MIHYLLVGDGDLRIASPDKAFLMRWAGLEDDCIVIACPCTESNFRDCPMTKDPSPIRVVKVS